MQDCLKVGKGNQNWLPNYRHDPEFTRNFKSASRYSQLMYQQRKAKWLQKSKTKKKTPHFYSHLFFFSLNRNGFTFLFPQLYVYQYFHPSQMWYLLSIKNILIITVLSLKIDNTAYLQSKYFFLKKRHNYLNVIQEKKKENILMFISERFYLLSFFVITVYR